MRVGVGLHTYSRKSATVLTMVAINITGFLPKRSPKRTKNIEPRKNPKRTSVPKRDMSCFEMHTKLYFEIQLSSVNSLE